MCDLCEQNASCERCGKLVCFDVMGEDDIIAPAAASMTGDLMCRKCAIDADEEETARMEFEFDPCDYCDDAPTPDPEGEVTWPISLN